MSTPLSVSTLEALSDALVPSLEDMDPSLRAETVAQLADAFVEQSRTRRVDRSLNEARTYYVIHEADLNLLKDVVDVARSFFPKFNPIASLPVLVALLFRYRRKRARIDAEQAAVLIRLRKALPDGRTPAQLSQELDLRSPMSEARVGEVLESLLELPLTDGTTSDFVSPSGNLWRARDV